jgi:NitT/TauT family transport system substrate-binding protein
MAPKFFHSFRGIKGDFFEYLKPSVTPEISPVPSFPKRGNPNLPPQPTGKNKSVKILGLALLLLFFPGWLNAQEPLRAGTIFSATQAPLWAAKEGRFFEKYGIKNLEVIQFSGGQPVTRALIGGDIQISTTGGAAVVNARLKGADTVIIARTVGVFPYTLYVSKDIHNASELKGKRLAVSTVGGSGYVAMQYALRKLGLDPDKDVAMLQVGDFGTRLASLASGTVQGTLLLPPFTLRAREFGLRPLYDLVGSGIQYPINQITTRQSFIKSQRETVKNFLKGLVAGLARFRTDREFGVKILGQNLRETDPKILQETYDFWLKVFPKIPNPGPEDATVFLEFMQVKEQRDWKEFVDPSLMEELEREGFLSSVYK